MPFLRLNQFIRVFCCVYLTLIFFIICLYEFEYSLLVDYSTTSKLNRIAQKLGIPEPPKRPVIGYIRFQLENSTALKQSAKSQKELFSLVAAKWRHLSPQEKEKYNEQFKTEMVTEYTILFRH